MSIYKNFAMKSTESTTPDPRKTGLTIIITFYCRVYNA